MTAVSAKEFLKWVAEREIIPDDRYSYPQTLVYKPYRQFDRFWTFPTTPTRIANFIATILQQLPPWENCSLWPRGDCWTVSANTSEDWVTATIYRAAGIPDRWKGAVQFTRNELASIVAVLFAHAAFGCDVYDDVFFIPDHGKAIAGVDHHNAMWVSFACEQDLEPFVDRLKETGFELPTETPDDTFKRPAWMLSTKSD